jgi:hypothetical protein
MKENRGQGEGRDAGDHGIKGLKLIGCLLRKDV